MLIGHSIPAYILIRLAIFGLRIIAPLSLLYTLYIILGVAASRAEQDLTNELRRYRLPLPLEIYLFLEAAFFLVVYLPLKIWLQSAARHPPAADKAERRALFQRSLETVSDPERYLSGWFLEEPIEAIGRDSVEEFVAWSLMNEPLEKLSSAEVEEIGGYVDEWESKLGRPLEMGRGDARPLLLTFDRVPMQHRPLLWYLIVGIVDFITHVRLLLNSFRFYRSSLVSTLLTFPIRPLAFFGRSQRPQTRLSYWYREHTAKDKLPVVFIHGIGIGLYTYVNFVTQLAARESGNDDDDDGDVGVIVIELLPISARICPEALTTSEMKAQIQHIVDAHGWEDFVLIGHSYGTAIATTLLHDSMFSRRIKAAMLMDPICFLLHLPDVAYHFTRRHPRRANECMLHYFSAQDMLISHTLARHFFWSEYILWKEDIDPDLPMAVTLSAKDLIVPTRDVWEYLTGSAFDSTASRENGELEGAMTWKKGKIEVLCFENFDHAGLFMSKGARRGVTGIAKRLCQVNASSNP